MEPFLFDEVWFRAVVGLTLGLVLGSFLTMLTYRLPRGLSIVSPPSSCPSCKTRLKPRDLIPVLSWAINQGRCRFCQTPMSWRYVLIEGVMAYAATLIITTLGLSWQTLAALITLMIVLAFIIMKLEKKLKQ